MNEFSFIQALDARADNLRTNQLHAANPPISKAIGDDAAVIDLANLSQCAQQLTICTDTLVAGRHFLGDDDWLAAHAADIGYKALLVNISDLAAMGAKPHSVLLAAALPSALQNKAWLTDLTDGVLAACTEFGVVLIGGDTTGAPILSLTVTAQGFAPRVICRDGARVGDGIFVSGAVGAARLALQSLLDFGDKAATNIAKKIVKNHPELLQKLHRPTARTALGLALNGARFAKMGGNIANGNAVNGGIANGSIGSIGWVEGDEAAIASAMLDISDGLYQDLGHILSQSNRALLAKKQHFVAGTMIDGGIDGDIGIQNIATNSIETKDIAEKLAAKLWLDKLPYLPPLAKLPTDLRLLWQLTGGDDYELLFTVPRAKWGLLPQIAAQTATAITQIGEIVAVDDGLDGLSLSVNSKPIGLFYQNKRITDANPYPFLTMPNLSGFSHF